MGGKHIVASGAAALALAAWPGAPRADDAALALASQPFSLGEMSTERAAQTALRVGRFDCNGCFEVPSRFTVVAWDLSATAPLAHGAAVFVLQPILFRSGGGAGSHQFPGALTVGARHVGAIGPALDLAAAVSASFAFPGGSKAEVTGGAAGRMIDDSTLYATELSTLRIELDARWRSSPLFAQAQFAIAAHGSEDSLLGSGRAGLGAGVELAERAALLAELTLQLGIGELTCDHCSPDQPSEGPGRPALSVGGRVALTSAWALGARGLLPLTEVDGQERSPSLSVTADARF
jgi:hypothetical protein